MFSFGEQKKVRHCGCFWHRQQSSTMHKAYSSTCTERWYRCLVPRLPSRALVTLLQAKEPLLTLVSWSALLRVNTRGLHGACPVLTVPVLVLGKRKGMNVIIQSPWPTASFTQRLVMGGEGSCSHKFQEASFYYAVCHFQRARPSLSLHPFR